MLRSNLTVKKDERTEEYQKLLASPADTHLIDLAALLSPNNQFRQDETNLGIKIERDELTSQFNTTFTEEEIYEEARRYNLAFIRTKQYEGEYGVDFLKKLQAFFDEKGISKIPDDISTLMYVLAPAPSDIEGKQMKYPAKDPLMFYRAKPGYYVLIDGDKSYVTPINWWLGFKNYSPIQCRIVQCVENFVVLTVILYGLSYWFSWGVSSYFSILLMFGAFLGMLIRMGLRKSKGSEFPEQCSSYFNKYKYN